MAIACNVLAAIGGTPRIAGLDPGFPSHGLPGGAEPDLTARLAQLSPRQLESFMRIELPTFLAPPELLDEQYPTIAKLYDAIRGAIAANPDELRAAIRRGGTANQVGDDIGFTTIDPDAAGDPLEQVYAGIAEILEQGEGSSSGSLFAGAGSEGEESHYCKFAELRYGRRYQEPGDGLLLTRETEARFFGGAAIPFPHVVNTLSVPADGYAALLAADPSGAAVAHDLANFDAAYSAVMRDLDAVWNGAAERSWPTLGQAVGSMMELRVIACFRVMAHEVPPALVARLGELYPDEHAELAAWSDVDAPLFYGPRFRNLNPPA